MAKKPAGYKNTFRTLPQAQAAYHVNVEVPNQLVAYYNQQTGSSIDPKTGADQAAGPPVDPTLVAQQNAANLNLALGSAWDTYKTGQLNASYGNLDNPAADAASNPYSQAALAFKRYNEAKAGTLNSYASQGQLYSGALQNAQEANASNYAQGLDQLRKAKQGALDDITRGQIDRYSQVGADIGQDKLASLLRALGVG